jgi:TPR repeat protein
VAKDLAHAKDLYMKAASLGNAEASAQLARLNGKRK